MRKILEKQVLSEQRGPLATISANRSLHTNSTKTICFCAFGQNPWDHFGRKSGDPEKCKKAIPGPGRPDHTRRAQKQSTTTAKATNKPKKEKRQMLENKAKEHQKCPPKASKTTPKINKKRYLQLPESLDPSQNHIISNCLLKVSNHPFIKSSNHRVMQSSSHRVLQSSSNRVIE
mgnify:CR=1 FL=1